MLFYYKAKGTADEHFIVGEHESDTKKEAQEWLEAEYPKEAIEAKLIDKAEHTKLAKVRTDWAKKQQAESDQPE